MENFHLIGSNLHVMWLCLSWMVKSKSIAVSTHIFCTHKIPLLKFFRPLRQQWSAFAIRLLPPLVANVICEQPLYPTSYILNQNLPHIIQLQHCTVRKNIVSINFPAYKKTEQIDPREPKYPGAQGTQSPREPREPIELGRPAASTHGSPDLL